MSARTIVVDGAAAGQRLDILLTAQMAGYSRAALQRGIKLGEILVNGRSVKPRYIVREADQITVALALLPASAPQSAPKDLAVPILYEDKDLLVINKPAGILVHKTEGSSEQTIADWLAARYPAAANLSEENGRAGIVHRLDKETSGALLLAKTPLACTVLREQFKKRRVKKEYLALVFGVPRATEGRITRPLIRSKRNPRRRTVAKRAGRGSDALSEGKPAITEWRLERPVGTKYALLRVFPFTGRTHQIRVHLHHIGHPIVGDSLYIFKRQKPPAGVTRQLLHATQLTFKLPSGKHKSVTAPLPEDFQSLLEKL
jgi:23S rRNA pseudouridine1911/1915/1917 synthase